MKAIRWWGLVVFFTITVLVVLAWYLLAPHIIARSIEEAGTEALGAQVDVENVELELFPVAITINRLAATDPDQPMRNLFESGQIKLAIDSESLFWKKVIVDEMVVDGLRLDTPRQTSGELAGGRKSAQLMSDAIDIEIPQIEEADIKKMVDDANLITLQRIDTLKASQERIKSEWERDLDKEAFDKRVAEIQVEYKRLSDRLKKNKLNLVKDRKAWKALKKSIDAERKLLASLSDKIKKDKGLIGSQFAAVKRGPEDDLNAVLKNYGLDSGVDGLVDKYLGPQFTPWVKRALEMAKSVDTASSEDVSEDLANITLGKRVLFTDQQTFPDILIKKIKLNGGDANWQLDGNGFDLGYFPWLTGKPAKINMALSGSREGNIKVTSDWPTSQKMTTTIQSNITSWPVEKFVLTDSPEGAWAVDSGTLSADINGELTLDKIDLIAELSIQSPKVSVSESLQGWQQSVTDTVNQQARLDFTLKASGSLAEPSIRLSSNLEGILKSALGDQARQQLDKLSGPLKEKIAARVGDTSALEGFDGNFDQWQSKVGDLDSVLKGILGKIKI